MGCVYSIQHFPSHVITHNVLHCRCEFRTLRYENDQYVTFWKLYLFRFLELLSCIRLIACPSLFLSLSHTHTHMYSHTAPQKSDCCWGQADIKTSISTVQEGQPESIVGRKMRSRNENSGRTWASGGGGSQESKTPRGVVVVTIQTTKLDSWLQLKTQVQKKGCIIKRFFSECWKVLYIESHILITT